MWILQSQWSLTQLIYPRKVSGLLDGGSCRWLCWWLYPHEVFMLESRWACHKWDQWNKLLDGRKVTRRVGKLYTWYNWGTWYHGMTMRLWHCEQIDTYFDPRHHKTGRQGWWADPCHCQGFRWPHVLLKCGGAFPAWCGWVVMGFDIHFWHREMKVERRNHVKVKVKKIAPTWWAPLVRPHYCDSCMEGEGQGGWMCRPSSQEGRDCLMTDHEAQELVAAWHSQAAPEIVCCAFCPTSPWAPWYDDLLLGLTQIHVGCELGLLLEPSVIPFFTNVATEEVMNQLLLLNLAGTLPWASWWWLWLVHWQFLGQFLWCLFG